MLGNNQPKEQRVAIYDMANAKILTKAMQLLDIIARSKDGVSAAELADQIQVHRTSVYRYLNTFLDLGYIRKDAKDRYHLGNKVLELSSFLLRKMRLREVAHPHLVSLSSSIDKTVHLCVLDGTGIIYLDKVENQRTLPIMSRIGSRAPAYCTGVGKALLSSMSMQQLVPLLGSIEFEARTPNTLVDPVSFLEEIERTREQGYAIDDEEHEQGVVCLATTLREYGGQTVGAISITGLRRDFETPEQKTRLLERLLQAAQAISKELGFLEP